MLDFAYARDIPDGLQSRLESRSAGTGIASHGQRFRPYGAARQNVKFRGLKLRRTPPNGVTTRILPHALSCRAKACPETSRSRGFLGTANEPPLSPANASTSLATGCEMLPCCVALSCRPKWRHLSLFSEHLGRPYPSSAGSGDVENRMITVCDDINPETVIACHSSK
jgi:hypothetical protein